MQIKGEAQRWSTFYAADFTLNKKCTVWRKKSFIVSCLFQVRVTGHWRRLGNLTDIDF